MKEDSNNFNLLEEPWIPVLWNHGKFNRVGIREALTQSGRIRQIAATNPMDRVAILRFLLALLYWCQGNPTSDKNLASLDSFPSDWFKNLDENRECFNLLGEGKRFYQRHIVEPCKNENRQHEIIPLIHEIPNGDDKWHFRHSTDKVDGLCRACCARGLLRLPIFASGEGRGWHQGINGTPPIYIMPMGITLLETLVLNWTPSTDLGEPTWVQPDIRPTPDQQVPLLTGLTLLARRVWLHDPVEETDTCIACGSRGTPIIKTCEYQSSGSMKNDHWDDPHVIYSNVTQRKALKAEDLTSAGKFEMDRPWLDLLARIVETNKYGPESRPLSFLVIGFATDKAKNIDVWERVIALPPRTSIENISATLLQQWRKQSWGLEKRIDQIMRSKIVGIASVTTIRPHVEGTVSVKTCELLARSDVAWEEAVREYPPMMKIIAKSLSPGFTTEASIRRREIEKVLPDMRPKPAKKKKGGDK